MASVVGNIGVMRLLFASGTTGLCLSATLVVPTPVGEAKLSAAVLLFSGAIE